MAEDEESWRLETRRLGGRGRMGGEYDRVTAGDLGNDDKIMIVMMMMTLIMVLLHSYLLSGPLGPRSPAHWT